MVFQVLRCHGLLLGRSLVWDGRGRVIWRSDGNEVLVVYSNFRRYHTHQSQVPFRLLRGLCGTYLHRHRSNVVQEIGTSELCLLPRKSDVANGHCRQIETLRGTPCLV